MILKKNPTKQELEAHKRRVLASFRKFAKGKTNEELFPEKTKRAYESLKRAGLKP